LLANAKRQLFSPAHSLDLDANIQDPCSWYCMHGDGSLAVGGIHKPHMHALAVHQKTEIKQGVHERQNSLLSLSQPR
jgi:hypothetical protein